MILPRPAILRAVMIKDLRLFWPFTAAIVALAVLALGLQLTGLADLGGAKSIWACGQLAAGFLMIALVQQDPPSSDTHDWLIRPIGKLELLTAKALFIALFTLLPLAIGYAAIALTGGASPSAVLEALGGGTISAMVTVPVIMAFASLTRNIGLAIAAAIALAVVDILLAITSPQNAVQAEPVRWLLSKPAAAIMLPLSLAAMWLAYDRREMVKSRALFAGGAAILLMLVSYIPASALFAAEQALAGNAAAAAPVKLSMAPGCFADAREKEGMPSWITTKANKDKRSQAAEKFALDMAGSFAPVAWTPQELDDAGPSPVAFTTRVDSSGVPAGDRLVVDHVQGGFVDTQGHNLVSPKIARRLASTFRHNGQNDFEESWLMSRPQAAALTNARFQIDYDLTLMKPTATYALPADGQKRHLQGLGDCSFKSVSGKAVIQLVECRLSGAAPAMVVTRVDGYPDKHGQTSYAPKWLQLGGESYVLDVAPSRIVDPTAPVPSVTAVTLTTYEAVSHVHRDVLAPPGARGGPASACPL